MKIKKKQKADKMKYITPMVLTNGGLEQIGDRIQEVTAESWNKWEDIYSALLTSVQEHIAELKIFAQTIRQPMQVVERIG